MITKLKKIINNDIETISIIIFNILYNKSTYIENKEPLILNIEGKTIPIEQISFYNIYKNEEQIDYLLSIYKSRNEPYYKIWIYSSVNDKLPTEIYSTKLYNYIKENVLSYKDKSIHKDQIKLLEKIPNWKWDYITLSKEYIKQSDVLIKIINERTLDKRDIKIFNEIKRLDKIKKLIPLIEGMYNFIKFDNN